MANNRILLKEIVLGTEPLNNPYFNEVTGWNLSPLFSYKGGALYASKSGVKTATQTGVLTIGKTYTITIAVRDTLFSTGDVYVKCGTDTSTALTKGTHTFELTADNPTFTIEAETGWRGYIDYVECKENDSVIYHEVQLLDNSTINLNF